MVHNNAFSSFKVKLHEVNQKSKKSLNPISFVTVQQSFLYKSSNHKI